MRTREKRKRRTLREKDGECGVALTFYAECNVSVAAEVRVSGNCRSHGIGNTAVLGQLCGWESHNLYSRVRVNFFYIPNDTTFTLSSVLPTRRGVVVGEEKDKHCYTISSRMIV